MTTDRDLALYELLSMANEDVNGLYEAVWRLNTVFPDKSEPENRQLAEELVRRLVAGELVYVCREDRTFGGPKVPSRVNPVPADEVDSVLADSESWEPYDDEGVGFEATERGYHVWISLGRK